MIANMVSNHSAIKTLVVCMWSHLSVSSDESHEARECRFSRQDEAECAFSHLEAGMLVHTLLK